MTASALTPATRTARVADFRPDHVGATVDSSTFGADRNPHRGDLSNGHARGEFFAVIFTNHTLRRCAGRLALGARAIGLCQSCGGHANVEQQRVG
jgi:hypothetical protein